MGDKCIVCEKEISSGDIFMKVELDMRRLVYDENEDEENFLIPNGPIHLEEKFYLCQVCSHSLMRSTPKDIAVAISRSKDMKTLYDFRQRQAEKGDDI